MTSTYTPSNPTHKRRHSDYWLRLNDDHYKKSDNLTRLHTMAGIRRSVGNFVKILTGLDIPVVFSSGGQSYTDNKRVVISATNDLDLLDSMVGLALHEASHIKYSQLVWFRFFERHYRNGSFTSPTILPYHLYDRGYLPGNTTNRASSDLKFLLNILEDRRIDDLSRKAAPGYRQYYDALYSRYFFDDPEVHAFLASDKGRVPTVDNYLSHICFASVSPETADPTVLPEMDKILPFLDIQRIRRYNSDTYGLDPRVEKPMYVDDAVAILEIIYRNAVTSNPLENPAPGTEDENGEPETGEAGDKSDLPNYDMDSVVRKLGEIWEFVNGTPHKDAVSPMDEDTLEIIDNGKASIVYITGDEFDGKVKVVVFRKFERSMIDSPVYGFARGTAASTEAVTRGISLGARLVSKLASLGDASTLVYSRNKTGTLDKRLYANLGWNDANVFQQTKVIATNPKLIDISIDSSTSMWDNGAWINSLALAIALAYVADKVHTIDVRISLRATDNGIDSNDPAIAIVYDSREDSFRKIVELFPHLTASGGTPEGLAYAALSTEILADTKGTERYFINMSDGMPACYIPFHELDYVGDMAHRHTRKEVDKMRNAGIHILSYFIGSAPTDTVKNAFKLMYGATAEFISPNNVFDIARTVNKLLLGSRMK